ncbi:TetR/AcrR family transcriptional regulator [Actinomadura livida]|uniref:AcrR family transcriptional regulator n=1 Tax=Actinomadura livida TaxID=79909 RepID=A0A7W7IIG8_9ACTN|nr:MULTISPECIES: TetR/AcrR family transcriptional regulator [Actinomadura]MBB4777714.1 AcrR family transcriptional regulator [Actinomadura catellatispora]GGT99221.1 TetR family transcriptional regulator [Actinomadura livida]
MSPQLDRGRIDKRKDILDAAFAVFAREGYPQARVDQIAAEAGVAKATVYNHFGDKENLFRETIAALSERALARNLAAVALLAKAGDDLPATLTNVGTRLVDCYCDPQSWALRRLLYAETPQFPDLLELTQVGVAEPVAQALADRLARLALEGDIDISDPVLAAEHLTALLTGPLEARSRFGTRRIPRLERKAIAESAVGTFLSAFAPRP